MQKNPSIDSMFSYLLNREIHESEKPYLETIVKIEDGVTQHVYQLFGDTMIDLFSNYRNMEGSLHWVNHQFVELYKTQMTCYLINPITIDFFQNS